MKITKFNIPIYDWNIWFVDYSNGIMGKKERFKRFLVNLTYEKEWEKRHNIKD